MLTSIEKNELKKEQIISNGYPSLQNIQYRTNKLIGTLYIINKMDYGFHIYHIHEPDDHNPLAGKQGIITEMFYDLRNKVYWIKRNDKEIKFSVRNIDSIFNTNGDRTKIFDFISTPNNQELYSAAFSYLGAMGNEITEMFGRFFHRLITEHSYFEQLHKAGIKNINEKMIKNHEGKNPQEILGLNKTQWKIVTKFKVSPSAFDSLYDCNKQDIELISYLNYISTLENEFGIEKVFSFMNAEKNYIYTKNRHFNNNSAIRIADTYNLPIKKVLRYLYFECDVSQGLEVSTAIHQYGDYIRMTNEMGYERIDRYPKFLRTFHDIASRNYKIKLDELQQKEWDKKYIENAKYEYSYNGYKFILPESAKDLVKEGNVLGHCVGSYVNKVWKGESIILFLREKEDIETPLVTIEIKNDIITQARGKMNNDPTMNQHAIIKKYAEKLKLQYK